jgi:hypothetical protein
LVELSMRACVFTSALMAASLTMDPSMVCAQSQQESSTESVTASDTVDPGHGDSDRTESDSDTAIAEDDLGSFEPPPPQVVRVEAANPSDQYSVRLTVDQWNGTCETPCTLMVPAGDAVMSIQGAATFEQTIPLGWEPSRVTLRRRNDVLFWTGMIAVLAGTPTAIAGVIWHATADPTMADSPGVLLGMSGLVVASIGFGLMFLAGQSRAEVTSLPSEDMASDARAPTRRTRAVRLRTLSAAPLPQGAWVGASVEF